MELVVSESAGMTERLLVVVVVVELDSTVLVVLSDIVELALVRFDRVASTWKLLWSFQSPQGMLRRPLFVTAEVLVVVVLSSVVELDEVTDVLADLVPEVVVEVAVELVDKVVVEETDLLV